MSGQRWPRVPRTPFTNNPKVHFVVMSSEITEEKLSWGAFGIEQRPDFEKTFVEYQDAHSLTEYLSSDSVLRSDGIQRTGYKVYIPHTCINRILIQITLAKLQTISFSEHLNHQKAHVTEVVLCITQMPSSSLRSSSVNLTSIRGLGLDS